MNGVEFTPASGVRLKRDIVTIYDGKHTTADLHANIYQHASLSPDREVCIVVLDEAFTLETDGLKPMLDHFDRLAKAGVGQRILACEGETG